MIRLLTLVVVFVCYFATTAYDGYQRGAAYNARMFGQTRLGETMAASNAPVWLTASPLFWQGIDMGLGSADSRVP